MHQNSIYSYCEYRENSSNMLIFKPRHEKACRMPYANNNDADQPAHQPAHQRSLISVFVIRQLDCIKYLVSIYKIQTPSSSL